MNTRQIDPERQAQDLLDAAWEGRGFPVDPVTICRSMGLRVVEGSLPPDVSGAIVKKAGEDPVVIVEASDSTGRKRFTCAHELGHFIYRSTDGADSYEYVDLRDPKSSFGTKTEEIFANKFAAALLMPAREIRELARSQTPQSLAIRFGVSLDAMTFRFKNLGLPTESPERDAI